FKSGIQEAYSYDISRFEHIQVWLVTRQCCFIAVDDRIVSARMFSKAYFCTCMLPRFVFAVSAVGFILLSCIKIYKALSMYKRRYVGYIF
ncbi:MAG: hypothetical protein IKC72_02130, partial [Clostridia bacterium]|nr:hypothetical protein [Clostridia bacterium]